MALHDATVQDLPEAREQVEEMLRRRDPFPSIEAFLDSADLDPDAKAALWLLAWSEQGHLQRRGVINEAITAMARPRG
jgi:hypothetical protein